MKKIFFSILAGASLLTSVWFPFYVDGVLLPNDWMYRMPDPEFSPYWWSFPMFATLLLLSLGFFVLGIWLFVYKVKDQLEEDGE